MNFTCIKLEIANQIAVITMSRPEALNALNKNTLDELYLALEQVESNKARVLVITGQGEKSFVAGADIKEIDKLDIHSAKAFAEFGQKLFRKIEDLKIPTIAAVNGFALGGGLELALACDFIYASENAVMGLPEVSLGIMPGFGGTVRLARRINPGMAKELTMTGKKMKADEALKLGLVNKVLNQSNLMDEVLKTARQMAALAPLAIDSIKKSIDQSYGLNSDAAMKLEANFFGELFKTQDQKEGTKAFIEKRKAEFTGK